MSLFCGLDITFIYETIFYKYLYKNEWINGRPSNDAYKLNYYHNYGINSNELYFNCFAHFACPHIYDDNQLIYGYDDVSILKCGHAFHSKCLRVYERAQYYRNKHKGLFMEPYRCPVKGCKRMYNWRGKWKYKYIDTDLFDDIRDVTLLKHLPTGIENIITHFVNPFN